MIRIIKDTKEHVIFEKDNKDERWFGDDCSDERLLIECNRTKGKIKRVQFEDGGHIASVLNVYLN